MPAGAHSAATNGHGRPLRVLIAGGGTGGHVYPGLAVAEALQALVPAAEIRFAGTRRGLEAVVVPRAGHRLHLVTASGFRGLGPGARLRFVLNFALGLAQSLWLLLRWRPDVVLGTGGYASAPVLAAARLLRIACALQEQNARPGAANRLLAGWAERIYLGFAAAADFFPGRATVVTGNPVLAEFGRRARTSAPDDPTGDAGGPAPTSESLPPAPDGPASDSAPPRGEPAAPERELRLLVFGGSRGAHAINRAVCEAAAHWRQRPELALWIQTGTAERDEVARAFADFPAGRVRVDAYLFDMATALGWADLAVCRAGAMTLAELTVVGRPAVLVPYPHAADGHQLGNARQLSAAGAAILLEDERCTGENLTATIDELAGDRERLTAMARAAAAQGRPGAAGTIARDLLALAGQGPGLPADVPGASPTTESGAGVP
jgi:UDP-N-acetylglucosamine--N-acetylmuramyl-(pentapeptide) pyrophosphoryl-undecaprenol N-acetylglucosamine transferase